jgi:hypothetical protein
VTQPIKGPSAEDIDRWHRTFAPLDPFVKGFAHEAIARAAAIIDDIESFTEHLELALAELADVVDDEDQEILQADLAEMSEE